jgi:hypothetical protein
MEVIEMIEDQVTEMREAEIGMIEVIEVLIEVQEIRTLALSL